MASSLELNKVMAGVLTAGILASGSGILAGILYGPHHGHEEHAFSVAVVEDAGEASDEPAVPFANLLAEADPAAGEAQTRACAACHSFDEGGADKVGPHLWDIVGRDVASSGGFSYSDALQGMEGGWDYDKLDGFLAAPRDYAPGTAMSYAGLKDDKKRADLIAYLATLSANPVPLPEPVPVEESSEAAPAAEGGEDAAAAEGAEAAPTETAEAAEEAPAAEEAAEAAQTETAEAAPTETAEAAPTETAEAAPAAEEVAEAAPAETAEEAAAADGGGELVAMVAAADPAAGQKLFRQCAACHSVDEGGGNRVGPALWGVYDRDVATGEGFNYSPALQEVAGNWDVEKLDHYLANPKEFAPGNKMAFAGVRKPEDRAALIAYLHSLSDAPVPLQ